jgi:hypothetical protein
MMRSFKKIGEHFQKVSLKCLNIFKKLFFQVHSVWKLCKYGGLSYASFTSIPNHKFSPFSKFGVNSGFVCFAMLKTPGSRQYPTCRYLSCMKIDEFCLKMGFVVVQYKNGCFSWFPTINTVQTEKDNLHRVRRSSERYLRCSSLGFDVP